MYTSINTSIGLVGISLFKIVNLVYIYITDKDSINTILIHTAKKDLFMMVYHANHQINNLVYIYTTDKYSMIHRSTSFQH